MTDGGELLRAKDDCFIGDLTLAQLISLGILSLAALLWVRRRLRGFEHGEARGG